MADQKFATVQLEVTHSYAFEFHAEYGTLLIDKCEGVKPGVALSLFDDWIIEAMLEKSK